MKYYKIQWYDHNGNTDGSTVEDYEHNCFTTPKQAKDFMQKMGMTTDVDDNGEIRPLLEGIDYDIVAYTVATSTPNMTIIRRI